MFNPFYPFTDQLLDGFVKKGKTFFVRQTFPRAKSILDEGVKGYFLFTHYDNLTTAQDHYGAIAHDPNRFLYDWYLDEHQRKLCLAASGLKDYRIFAAVFKPDWEKGITDRLKEQVRKYAAGLGWEIKRADGLDTNYELQFGELYLRLRSGTREVKIKFEEIENLL